MGVISGYAMPSGESEALVFDAFVTAVATGDEVQAVTLTAVPSGGNFTLTFDGHTTSSIPSIPSAPFAYFRWNKADLTPGTYDLAVNINSGGTCSPSVLYEVFDGDPDSGGTLLGVTVLDQTLFPTGNPAPSPEPSGLLRHDGFTLHWLPLGRFTFATTTLVVRVSCPEGDPEGRNRVAIDNLRIATTDGGTVVRLDAGMPPATVVTHGGPVDTSTQGFQCADDTHDAVGFDGHGAGVRYLVDPVVVRSALEALPSGGAGNFAVTGDGSVLSPLQVYFQGSLGGSAQPLMTVSDGNVHVAEVSAGGILPVLHLNGSVTPVPRSWIFFDAAGKHMPTVSIYPPACSPDVVRQAAGQYDDFTHGRLLDPGSDGNWQLGGGGYYGQTWSTAGSTPTASWYFGPWKNATYRLSASWSAAVGQSTSVAYTIRSFEGEVMGAVGYSPATQTVVSGLRSNVSAYRLVARVWSDDPSGLAPVDPGGIAAVALTVTGTDHLGAPLTETLPAFTLHTPGEVISVNAFLTITSVSIPTSGSATHPSFVDLTVQYGTHTVDQTLAPSGDTESGATWEVLGTYSTAGDSAGFAVVQSNGTSATMIANGVRLERTSTDDTLRIAPGDTLTMTWGAGAFTTVNGPVAAQTSPLPLTNLVGGKLVGDPPSSHSCEIGVNVDRNSNNVGCSFYADFLAMTADVTDAWPTVLGGSFHQVGVNSSPPAFDADNKAWPSLPSGEYVLAWKGAGNCEVQSAGTGVTERSGAVYTGTPGAQNYRYYGIGGSPDHYGGEVSVIVHGTTMIGSGPTWNTDVTDVHLWPLGTDVNSPPKYHPKFLARKAALQCQRPEWEVNDGNATTYEDFQPAQSRISKNAVARITLASISSISPYSGPAWNLGGPMILVTSPTPHGLADYQYVQFSDDCNAVIHFDDASTFNLGATFTTVFVVDDVSFACVPLAPVSPSRTVVNTVTSPSGVVILRAGIGMSLQDIVEVFNAAPASRTLYFNSGASTTQDAITRVFTYLALNLKPGARVRHECMNETWNSPGSVNDVCCQAGVSKGWASPGDDIPFKVRLAQDHWAWGKAAWIAAGRDASDYIRVMGSWHVIPGYTARIVSYCVANGFEFGDEGVSAPYLRCHASFTRNPAGESFGPLFDRLTVGANLDQHEIYFSLGGYEDEVRAHLDQVTPHFPDARWAFYEGGPEIQALNQSNGTGLTNSIRVSHGIVRHPRWKAIYESLLGTWAASGLTAFHDYVESKIDGFLWPVYNCTDQVAYVQSTGQDAIQIDTPDRMDLIQSVTGTALNEMAARFDATATPDFSLAVTGTGSLVQGGTTTRTVTLAAIDGFTGSAVLSVLPGLPTGVTPSFSPGTLVGGGTVTSTLTLTASGSATTGTVTLTVQGLDSGDSLTHSATTSLTVTPASQPPPNSARRSRFKPMRRHRSARR